MFIEDNLGEWFLPAHPATAGEYTDPAFSQQLYYLQSMPLYVLDEKKCPRECGLFYFWSFLAAGINCPCDWQMPTHRLQEYCPPSFSLKADLTVLQPDRLVPIADVMAVMS
jgi:hypothetical protein